MNKVELEKLNQHQLKAKQVFSWPIWTKEPSRFEWTYDGDEECYILEGEFKVETENEIFHVKPGDFVRFKAGLKCTWDISHAVKKHYNFP